MTHRRLALCAVLLSAGIVLARVYAEDKPEALAQKAAEPWLALVDAGKYAESWDAASASFKTAITKEKWVEALKSVREPLGEVQSRNFRSANHMKDPPGAPPGEYVAIQYDTSFKNMNAAVETVVPTLEKDGQWRVSGYLVKKPD